MQTLNEFWKLIESVWAKGAFGIDLSTFLGALGIFAAFMIFRGLIARMVPVLGQTCAGQCKRNVLRLRERAFMPVENQPRLKHANTHLLTSQIVLKGADQTGPQACAHDCKVG